MKYNFFKILNEMCKPPALDINLYSGNTNIIAIGKTDLRDGWCHIDIAITNEDFEKILSSNAVAQLIVFDIEDFENTMEKLGMEKPIEVVEDNNITGQIVAEDNTITGWAINNVA